MKIIESLKELPLLEKRIEKNVQLVQLYSSEMDMGKGEYTFGTKEKQDVEVKGLVQSTHDLISRRAKIRRVLAITNAKVIVKIGRHERTITEWIEYRQKGVDLELKLFGALNDGNGSRQLQLNQGKLDLSAGVRIVRFYDEKAKNDNVSECMELKSMIDSTLEIVNATTDLFEEI